MDLRDGDRLIVFACSFSAVLGALSFVLALASLVFSGRFSAALRVGRAEQEEAAVQRLLTKLILVEIALGALVVGGVLLVLAVTLST